MKQHYMNFFGYFVMNLRFYRKFEKTESNYGNEEFTNKVMRKHKKQYKNLYDFLNSIE